MTDTSIAPVSPDEDPDSPTARLAAQILVETREELTRADFKASLLLGATGVIVGALLAASFARKWSPFELHRAAEAPAWAGIGCLALALIFLGLAVYPRFKNPQKNPTELAYFGHVPEFTSPEKLAEALEGSAADPVGRSLNQLRALSPIVIKKFSLIRRSLVSLAGAAALLVASALVQHFVR